MVAIGCDNMAVEVLPNPNHGISMPVHQHALAEAGVYLIENLALDELAREEGRELLLHPAGDEVPWRDWIAGAAGRDGVAERDELPLLLEHLTQRGQCQAQHSCVDCAEASHHPQLVEHAELIEQDQPIPASEAQRNAIGRRVAACRHGRHRNRPQIIVHFRRRDDRARTCLLDLASDGRIKRGQPDLAAQTVAEQLPRQVSITHIA